MSSWDDHFIQPTSRARDRETEKGMEKKFLIVVIIIVIFYDGPISEAKTRYNVG